MAQRIRELEERVSGVNSNRRSVQSEGWKCNCADCIYAVNGTLNYPSRASCNGCFRARTKAQNPPPHGRLVVVYRDNKNNETSEKESKKREARARKREEAAKRREKLAQTTDDNAPSKAKSNKGTVAVIPQGKEAPGPVAEAMAAVAKPASANVHAQRLVLSDEVAAKVPLLIPDAAQTIIASLALEYKPVMPDSKDPEAIVAKTIGDRGPAAKVAKVADLEAQAGRLRAMLANSTGGGDALEELAAPIRLKLEEVETTLAKAKRDVPSQSSELKAVQEARATYELNMQTHRDQQQRGCAKAKERRDARHAHLKNLKDQILILEKEMTSLENENDEAHKKRAAAVTSLDAKVLQLFDERIVALQPRPDQTANPAPPAASYVMPPSHLGSQPLALTAPVVDQVPSSLIELQEFRKKYEEMRLRMEAAIGVMASQFTASFEDITPDMLPPTQVPDDNVIASYGAIYHFLESWSVSGSAPFDWDAFDTAAGTHDVIEIVKKLLGPVWNKWYATAIPGPTLVVPRQLADLVAYCLKNVRQAFENEEHKQAMVDGAAKAMGAARESAKRLRKE